MKIFKKKTRLLQHLNQIRKKRIKVGLIPTMGCIHKGHLSLIKNSKNKKLYTIATIFINPLQFEKKEDFIKYPRSFNVDIKKIKESNCDVLFFPNFNEIYPKKVKINKIVKKYRNIMCDIYRPKHFDGVTTVVNILFSIIKPNFAFFGEKDFQQLMIIKNLVKIKKLTTNIIGCKSIRNRYGISISSRFNLLNYKETKTLNELGKIIKKNKKNFKITTFKDCLKKIKIRKIDYIDIRNQLSLKKSIKDSRVFFALYIGKVRIIDNFKI